MSFKDFVLDFFFPPRCAFCGAILEKSGDGVCGTCRKALPRTADTERKCDFVRAYTAPFYYEEPVRQGVLAYKFRNAPSRGKVFGRILRAAAAQSARRFAAVPATPPRGAAGEHLRLLRCPERGRGARQKNPAYRRCYHHRLHALRMCAHAADRRGRERSRRGSCLPSGRITEEFNRF